MKKAFAFFLSLGSSSLVFAEGAPASGASGGYVQTLIMIGVALVFFYFILWRPEQKRRKAQEAQRNAMKKGDRVTAMGIVGTIDKVQEKTVIVKMVDGAKVEFLKGAISDVQSGSSSESTSSGEDKSSSCCGH